MTPTFRPPSGSAGRIRPRALPLGAEWVSACSRKPFEGGWPRTTCGKYAGGLSEGARLTFKDPEGRVVGVLDGNAQADVAFTGPASASPCAAFRIQDRSAGGSGPEGPAPRARSGFP